MRVKLMVPLAAVLAIAVVVALLGSAEEQAVAGSSSASAEPSPSELAKFVTSGNAINLRLMALEELRNKTGTSVDAELLAIAKGSDFKMAIYATTSLGKKKTSTSKAALKKVLENSKLKKDVRMAAMTAIAVHFETSSDLTYLKAKAGSDKDLKARYYWLKQNVYNMGGK